MNILSVVEAPTLVKLSQQQYTFLMHLADEMIIFLDVLKENTTHARPAEQCSLSSSIGQSTGDMKITVCLACPTTFTLVVLDGIDNELSAMSMPNGSLDGEPESGACDTSTMNTSVDVDKTCASCPADVDLSIPDATSSNDNGHKLSHSIGLRKGKVDIVPKVSRGISQSSLITTNESVDDSSQWEQMSDDLDNDLDFMPMNNTFDSQTKAARIDIDDDSLSFNEKISTRTAITGSNCVPCVGSSGVVADNDTFTCHSSRSTASP
jgi:hypothetical protein